MNRIKSSDVKIQEMLFGYLAAPFCAMIANAIFASYLNRYYVDVLGWTKFGVFAALLPMVSSFVVILGNLMVGQWIDKSAAIFVNIRSAGGGRDFTHVYDAYGGQSRDSNDLDRG